MLVLSRKKGEVFFIGDIKVEIIEIRGNKARIGIEAPIEIPVVRGELRERTVVEVDIK